MKSIARELVTTVKKSATIDWTVEESVAAAMRANVKRLLARHKYPPDREEQAIALVIEQAELLAKGGAAEVTRA